MKKILTIVCFFMLFTAKAQLLTWSPNFVQETSSNVEITCDATYGSQGLLNYTPTSDVYVHIGCITSLSTSPSDWKYSKFTWATTNVAANCTYLGTNKWKYTITGGLRTFFGISNASEKILKIAILFRNGAGSKVQRNGDGSDMYITVYEAGLNVRIDTPFRQPYYIPIAENANWLLGNSLQMAANSSELATLKLYFNGIQVANSSNATTISNTQTITTSGNNQIIAEAANTNGTKRDTFNFFVASSVVVADPPTGLKEGVTYETGDTSCYILLYAPNKTSVSLIGDFNNWTQTTTHQLKRSVDGKYFWIRLTGLTSGVEYAYQFIIDGTLKVADYNTEKVLDPWNDSYISTTTYPNLKPYPTGKTTGIVSVLQTAKPNYSFTASSYVRPDKKNLAIYELLVRDFVAASNWKTLTDTLAYLKRLGINAIELMPVNEFEGNLSWGYNPSFYFSPDKYYGTEIAFKTFIDSCHKKGMAVIMDIAMNHSFGNSPMVQMYWDATNNIPAANNPWFNQNATHPYSVGYDFNHESLATKSFVDRVVEHWLTKYKIDGFRWDLSKGFTQTNNPNNVAAWGNYDASRVAIWKRIYDKMQSISSGSYCILEHFADNSEEVELSNYGMLLWGNTNYNFNQATMGFSSGWDFQSGIATARGWSNPHLVTYQESHDEERLMYKNLQFGNSNGSYNVRDLTTALKRNEMAAAFWAMIPGPKMMWQFGEVGYDYSINTCADGITINNNCRLDNKPIRWDYYTNANRKSLYDVYSALLRLKITPAYQSTFISNNITYSLSSGFKWMVINEANLRVMVIGNFDVTAQTGSVTFPIAGTWYSYLTSATITATGTTQSITLQPGEYYVYTDRNVSGTVVTPVINVNNTISKAFLKVYPNPIITSSIVDFELNETANISIDILDINGRIIENIFKGMKAKGKYKLPLPSSLQKNKNSGVYFIQLIENGKRKVEKIILLNNQY